VAEERVRIEIGFDGGTVVGALVAVAEADALQSALEQGAAGVVQLTTEDAGLLVVCNRVLYVKRFSRESRVGFGG
jgi:hypothetical protein